MNQPTNLKPPQHQDQQPGIEQEMHPKPEVEDYDYIGTQKLQDKVALITGGDSGIGKAVAIAFAKEGANIGIVYLNEDEDALETQKRIEEIGRRCVLLRGDIKEEKFCIECVQKVVDELGGLNVLVNNAAEQHIAEDIRQISVEQLESTFRTNIFSMFYFSKAALDHLKAGDTIINSTSVTAYRGSKHLIDYASTKGAIVSFTRSLSLVLAEKEIRVNGVAPGPIWTPLIPASFPEEKVEKFGSQVPMQRPAEPKEIAPCYVFLASKDSSYMSGQVLHPNGGEMIGG
ncbi:MAG: short-chain dehydrogenase/reductase [Gammaproteobacteria bacterium]|jgi:NAD(P)-dependent dehydrogenase (short-subunit alcohol dehydrogenase family)|nr:short-chain dehydrogenase/reductase [Gammaproteobacteria bacterium]